MLNGRFLGPYFLKQTARSSYKKMTGLPTDTIYEKLAGIPKFQGDGCGMIR
jgi:hypothetical protein